MPDVKVAAQRRPDSLVLLLEAACVALPFECCLPPGPSLATLMGPPDLIATGVPSVSFPTARLSGQCSLHIVLCGERTPKIRGYPEPQTVLYLDIEPMLM